MIIIAITLYLPQHLTFLSNRMIFYYNGDDSAKTAGTILEAGENTDPTSVVVEKVKETIVRVLGGEEMGGREL